MLSLAYDCSSPVKNIYLDCSCNVKSCLKFSTYPPFKLNAFDTTGPWCYYMRKPELNFILDSFTKYLT